LLGGEIPHRVSVPDTRRLYLGHLSQVRGDPMLLRWRDPLVRVTEDPGERVARPEVDRPGRLGWQPFGAPQAVWLDALQ